MTNHNTRGARISRRDFLTKTAQAVGAVAILQACTPSSGPQATAIATTPQLKGLAAQGILRWDTATEPANINPILSTTPAVRRIVVWTHNSLLRPTNKAGEYVPDLAAELPKTQNDGLAYDIKLRPGVVWHDGSTFSADDVVATMNTVANPQYGAVWRSRLDFVAGVEKIDANTIRVTMKKGDNRFFDRFGLIPIVKAAEAANKDLLARKANGTGPFKFVEWRSGDRIILEPNAAYFRKGLPKVKGLQYVISAEASGRVVNLANGETALTSDVPFREVDTLKGRGVTLYPVSGAPSRFMFDINILRPDLADVNFRKALAYAIDRQGIIDTVFKGQATVGEQAYPPSNLYYDSSLKPYGPRPDLAKAKSFLSQAKAVPTRPIVIQWANGPSEFPDAATILQANFKDLGVDAQIMGLESGTAVQSVFDGKYDLSMQLDFPGTSLVYTPLTLTVSWQSASPTNWWKYKDAETDRQIDIILSSSDEKAAETATKWLQQKDIDLVHRIAICHPYYIEAQGVPLKGYVPINLGNLPYSVEEAAIPGF